MAVWVMTHQDAGLEPTPVALRAAPRILMQSGSYELDNLGDQSMLQAAIIRIGARLPLASFSVLSRNGHRLRTLAPDAHEVPVENRSEWKWVRAAYLGARKMLPNLDPFIRRRFPRFFAHLLRSKARSLVNQKALRDTQFIVLSGGGYINDVFPGQAWSSLERIRVADAMGIPFAVVGHAFGPLRDPALRSAATELLPRARFVSVRERLASLPILAELGVAAEKIFVTGDDAVEHAWASRGARLGRGLGVNLRVAPYAGMTAQDAVALRNVLREVTTRIDCELIPLPTCLVGSVESESDATVAAQIIDGLEHARIDSPVPATIRALIERVSECRLVITGSYHCAVFALSQGIPSICIYSSEYYALKFRGLADQFESGCDVIDRSDPAFHVTLREAILKRWHEADELRPELLLAAGRQVEAGNQAYDALCAVIAGECETPTERRPERVA